MRKPMVFPVGFLLILGLTISAIGCCPQPEAATGVKNPVPIENGIVIEMHTRTTMAGVKGISQFRWMAP